MIILLYPTKEVSLKSGCPVNVSFLRTLVPATEQNNDHFSVLEVIHPISGSAVQAHFGHAIPADFVVTKVALGRPVNPAQNSDFSADIPQPVQPFLKYVDTSFCLIVDYFHKSIVAFKRIEVKYYTDMGYFFGSILLSASPTADCQSKTV
jgi:hypothetical protein